MELDRETVHFSIWGFLFFAGETKQPMEDYFQFKQLAIFHIDCIDSWLCTWMAKSLAHDYFIHKRTKIVILFSIK